MILQAQSVGVPDNELLDYGEGCLEFRWSDPLYGNEGLQIDLDGFCSRMMPFRCGQGPPIFVEVHRDRIRIRFAPALAKKLELDEEVEITFAISDEEFGQLERTIDAIG